MCHSYQVTFACDHKAFKLVLSPEAGIIIQGRKIPCKDLTRGSPWSQPNRPCGNISECHLTRLKGVWNCCNCIRKADTSNFCYRCQVHSDGQGCSCSLKANTHNFCSKCKFHEVSEDCTPGKVKSGERRKYQEILKQDANKEKEIKPEGAARKKAGIENGSRYERPSNRQISQR